jgi:hypothetical protein
MSIGQTSLKLSRQDKDRAKLQMSQLKEAERQLEAGRKNSIFDGETSNCQVLSPEGCTQYGIWELYRNH